MPPKTSGKWLEVKLKPLSSEQDPSHAEDFVRCEMTAIERFESRLQQECECRIRDHVLALQHECQDHVGSEAMKLRAELSKSYSMNRIACQG